MFTDKSILVTGGTGSFGRQFVRTVLQPFRVQRLNVYSRDEHKQYEMSQEFQSPVMRFFLGDVRDVDRLRLATLGDGLPSASSPTKTSAKMPSSRTKFLSRTE